jgi:hypothetical protein
MKLNKLKYCYVVIEEQINTLITIIVVLNRTKYKIEIRLNLIS